MSTLYELTEQYTELLNAIETDDPKLLEDTIASTGINEDLNKKFEGYGQVINQAKADMNEVFEEIKRLQTKKRTYDNNIKRLKQALIDSLAAVGKDRIKTPLFSFSIKNTRAVDVTSIEDLPVDYLVPQPSKPDKKAIKEAIESGQDVPGATIKFNESLAIR
ncbi:siphovirus Gp157 family protein [uncultured Lentilactobacillus sp.]|uniref:siphovirus Gp157 family protein n=1 Tax=uncultured Lentilactobacillus sp. TaxID=2805375 RepID=UPI00259A9988|nr:siphovirus Gp157 family protein [uncultured Lentilactobacillus sp.]